LAVKAQGAGLATDHAALAASFALALHAALPGWAVAVATGRAELGTDRAVGDAIERAAQRIHARQRLPGAPAIERDDTTPGPLDLDDVTAGLLDLRCEVAAGALGLELGGEHEVAESARSLLGRPTAFVGRERELAALEALFAECVGEPAARAAMVVAAAGVG